MPCGRAAARETANDRVPVYRNILFVCHANTSRSVIAEALLKRMIDERLPGEQLVVRSGGIAAYARDGALVSMDTRLVLRESGIDLPAGAAATDLKRNRHLIEEADLILTMTREQAELVRRIFPEAQEKEIYALKEFAGEAGDIEDPAGRGEEFYARCRDEIQRCLQRALEKLAPETPPR